MSVDLKDVPIDDIVFHYICSHCDKIFRARDMSFNGSVGEDPHGILGLCRYCDEILNKEKDDQCKIDRVKYMTEHLESVNKIDECEEYSSDASSVISDINESSDSDESNTEDDNVSEDSIIESVEINKKLSGKKNIKLEFWFSF